MFRATLNLLEEVLFLVKLHSSFCSGVHGCEKSVTDNGTEIKAVVDMILNPKKEHLRILKDCQIRTLVGQLIFLATMGSQVPLTQTSVHR